MRSHLSLRMDSPTLKHVIGPLWLQVWKILSKDITRILIFTSWNKLSFTQVRNPLILTSHFAIILKNRLWYYQNYLLYWNEQQRPRDLIKSTHYAHLKYYITNALTISSFRHFGSAISFSNKSRRSKETSWGRFRYGKFRVGFHVVCVTLFHLKFHLVLFGRIILYIV